MINTNQINLRLLRKFTVRNIRESKLRNFVMIMTIAITTALILTILTMTSAMDEGMKDTFKRQAGSSAHMILSDIGADQAEKISHMNEVAEAGLKQLSGHVIEAQGIETNMDVLVMDEIYEKHNFLEPDYGIMPIKSDEIVLSAETLNKLGVPAQLGESITLKWEGSGGPEEKEFKVAGYWTGTAKEKSSIWMSSKSIEDIKPLSYDATLLFSDEQNINDISEKVISSLELASDQYSMNWAYDSNTLQSLNQEKVLYYVAIMIILVSGGLIFFNIMQISVKFDIKLYGRMRTLGSGSAQIKGVVLCQIFFIGIAGILTGLVLGWGFGKYVAIRELSGSFPDMTVLIKPGNIFITMLLMLVAIFISGLIPAKTASNVSATEILKEDNSFGFTNKSEKHWPGLPFLFQLSLSSLGRNKTRSVLSIGFMALGLIMLSCVYATNESFDIDKYKKALSISDYSIVHTSFVEEKSIYDPQGMTLPESVTKKIDEMEGITEKGYMMSQEVNLNLPEDVVQHITSYYEANDGEIIDYMSYDVNWGNGYQKIAESGSCKGIVYGVDGLVADSLIANECLLQGNYDEDKFRGGNYAIAQGIYDPSSVIQPTYQVGDTIELGGKEFEVMAVVEAPAPITEGKKSSEAAFSLSFFIPSEEFLSIYGDVGIRKVYFNVNSSGEKNALKYFQEKDNEEITITSEKSLEEKYKRETEAMMFVQVLVSIIIFGIGLLNLINTMITATTTRRKEFGIMQSLGMTKKQLRTLLFFEGMNYAVVTLLISYFLSLLLISTVVKKYLEGQWPATYSLVLDPLLICTPVIFIITLAIPLLCYFQIVREPPIKRLENYDK